MAKKKKSRGNSGSPSPRNSAWQELVAILAASPYVKKVSIISQLRALRYPINKDNVGYVMTAARRRGNLCVFAGPNKGYTATPDGVESLVDIRKRRRVSFAWLRNAQAVVNYVRQHLKKFAATMTVTDVAELRKELSYHSAAIKDLTALRKRNGLK